MYGWAAGKYSHGHTGEEREDDKFSDLASKKVRQIASFPCSFATSMGVLPSCSGKSE